MRAAVEHAAQAVRARRRRGRADAAFHDPGHAGRHGPLLAHALARRHAGAAAAEQGARCCPTSSTGPTAPPAWTARPCSRAVQPVPRDARRHGERLPRRSTTCISPTSPVPAFAGRAALAHQRSAAAARAHRVHACRSTCRSSRRLRSIAATPSSGLPIGLQIAGQRFDDLGVLQVSRAFELIRDAQRPWPQPPSEALHHVD